MNEFEEREMYNKNIKELRSQIIKDAENDNNLAHEAIRWYNFYSKCPSDSFGFFLAKESLNKYIFSKIDKT